MADMPMPDLTQSSKDGSSPATRLQRSTEVDPTESVLSARGVIVRQAGLGFAHDLENRLTNSGTEHVVSLAAVPAREHFPQPRVDGGPGRRGHCVEWLRVDQIAARIFQQPPIEIEILERSATAVATS